MKRRIFTLLLLVLTLGVVVWNPSPAECFGCTDAAMEACNARAVEIERNCQYRGEDGGTAYTSCDCQSIRYVRDCYQRAGCSLGAATFMAVSPECFAIQ